MNIEKAVILAAGLGTRMAPMTNAIPKPMLPVVDKPILEYIIEEARESGIKDIVIIVNHQSEVIKKHFEGYDNIYFIHQPYLTGTAGALYRAKVFTGDEPFVLYNGDEIVLGETPCTKQLIDVFNEVEADVLTAVEVENTDMITHYNNLEIESTNDSKLLKIKKIVEKPTNPTTRFTSIGRYVLTSSIYEEIGAICDSPKDSEVYLTNAFEIIANKNKMFGYLYDGKRYDIGNKRGWLLANIEIAKKIGIL